MKNLPVLLCVFCAILCFGCRERPANPAADALESLAAEGSIPGAVALAARDGKIFCFAAAGFADLESRRPMERDTVFWIASQTKSVTAAALMALVDDGRASLDDPVSKYVPELKGLRLRSGAAVPDEKVTLRAILCHTAGFSEMPSASSMPKLDSVPLSGQMKIFAGMPLEFFPGEGYRYSNIGINIIGRVIEAASGIPYAEFVKERILDPLEMRDTSFFPSPEQAARIASPYAAGASGNGFKKVSIPFFTYPLNSPGREPFPAGGFFSTAEDVLKFCVMLAGGGVYGGKRILSEAAAEQMRKKQTPAGVNERYGLCMSLSDGGYGHGGIYGTGMWISGDGRVVLVYLVQRAGKFPKNGDSGADVFRRAAWDMARR